MVSAVSPEQAAVAAERGYRLLRDAVERVDARGGESALPDHCRDAYRRARAVVAHVNSKAQVAGLSLDGDLAGLPLLFWIPFWLSVGSVIPTTLYWLHRKGFFEAAANTATSLVTWGERFAVAAGVAWVGTLLIGWRRSGRPRRRRRAA